MALSNNERQVRYRARSKVLASAATVSVPLIERIANEWAETRNGLALQLELMEMIQKEKDSDKLLLMMKRSLEMKGQEAEILKKFGTAIWKHPIK